MPIPRRCRRGPALQETTTTAGSGGIIAWTVGRPSSWCTGPNAPGLVYIAAIGLDEGSRHTGRGKPTYLPTTAWHGFRAARAAALRLVTDLGPVLVGLPDRGG